MKLLDKLYLLGTAAVIVVSASLLTTLPHTPRSSSAADAAPGEYVPKDEFDCTDAQRLQMSLHPSGIDHSNTSGSMYDQDGNAVRDFTFEYDFAPDIPELTVTGLPVCTVWRLDMEPKLRNAYLYNKVIPAFRAKYATN